jgi:gliding motility-associated-like protein
MKHLRMAQFNRYLTFTVLLLSTSLRVSAQVPTFQDCLGATPICLGSYVNGNVITGTGNYPNEINAANSCLLTGERNDAWYVIQIGTSGNLNFSIIPNNPAHNYDWALYNLTTATCAEIYTNPSLEVSCNYSNLPGTTGANGLPGAQNNPVVPVIGGQIYLLNVSGFSSIQQNGYTINLTGSTAGVIDNTPPAIAGINAMNCGASSLVLRFSERVMCSSVSPADFTLTGPGGPYTINSVSSSACSIGATAARDYTLNFSPAIPGAGTYSLNLVGTVTDLCSNSNTSPQNFSIPIQGVNISFQTVDVTCFGGNNGSATAVVTGAPGPYSYQWSPSGGSGQTAQFLTAGTYTVTVTSAMGCSATSSVTITQPLTGLTASATVTPANGCAANGTASVTVSNGQPPFTYNWWPSGGNGSTATGLTAGGYMVTITDANQCVLNYFLNVPSASGPSINISNSSNVSCFGGNDGSATVTVSNATGPFTYNWLPSGGNAATATGLTAGNYTVEVIIAPGCTLTTGVTITQPPTALSVNVNSIHTSCGNNNGSIILSASGGAGSYSYQWSPNVSGGSSASNLAGGTYSVTVSDANGCTTVHSVVINASSQPVPSITNHNNVSCNGLTDGSTGVTVTGGAQPISYLWSNGQTTALLNNIPAGTYTVTVTDALGCSASTSDLVTQPALLTATLQTITHVKCYGDSTGAATVTTTGGNGGNSWSWNPSVVSGTSMSNVPAGSYTGTVTDAMGCSATVQVVINQPSAPLAVTGTIIQTTCGNNDGGISTTVTGGTGPYQYNWSNGSQSGNLSSLAAGNYSVTITDGQGCTINSSFTVQASDAPLVSLVSQSDASCFGYNDGNATFTVSGGQSPYTWSWQGGVSSGPSAGALSAGTYSVTVTDASGCAAFTSVTIGQPAQITVTLSQPSTICIGQSATITSIITGGVTPYTYQWSNGVSTAQNNVSPVTTSSYTLTVTDVNGCSATPVIASVNVNPPLSVSVNYPDSVCRGNQATITVTPSGGNGVYNYSWSNGMTGSANSMVINNNLSFTITLTDGCTTPSVQANVSISAVSSPPVSFNLPAQSGCAPFTASFSVPPGGPSGLIYLWSFGDGFTSTAANPSHTYTYAGNYNIQLTVAYAAAPACSTVLNFPQAVVVYDVPTARFIFDPPAPTINAPEVFFTDRSTGAASWIWNFGDGNISNDQNPRHIYADTGSYLVSLRILSQEGCRDSSYNLVQVKDEMQVWIPNAFTPDNSGRNDFFEVYGVGFSSYEIFIFDRWGKLIHRAKDSEKAWDGTDMSTGKPVPQGLYVYKVTIIDNAGHVHNRFNHVTVIR